MCIFDCNKNYIKIGENMPVISEYKVLNPVQMLFSNTGLQ